MNSGQKLLPIHTFLCRVAHNQVRVLGEGVLQQNVMEELKKMLEAAKEREAAAAADADVATQPKRRRA